MLKTWPNRLFLKIGNLGLVKGGWWWCRQWNYEDSPFRNPNQILYPEPPSPTTQNPTTTEDEDEDTLSMRKLVEAIDSHAELIDLEITSNPGIVLIST